MRTIRNVLFVGTFSVLALGLTGCESMQTARDKISSIDFPYFGSADTDQATAVALADPANCPKVSVVDDLKNLTQFETPSAPTPGTKISSITIGNMTSNCSLNDKTVALDIDLAFDGQLGPKATGWKTESRSFAYPYFIAVTTPTGEIMSKEVFAATIRYDGAETAVSQKESIRQVIPLRENIAASGYEILIGFQLTEDELNYSRMMAANPLAFENTAPVAEEKPKAKKKVAKKHKKEEPKVESAKVEEVKTEEVKVEATPAVETTPATTTDAAVTAAPAVETPAVTEAAPAAETTATTPSATPSTTEAVAPAAAPAVVTPETAPSTATPTATTAPATATPAVVTDSTAPATEPAPATATPADGATATVPATTPAVNPYAPPQTQVIHIKPDGSVEKQ